VHHHQWIAIWKNRHNRVIQGTSFTGNGHLRDETPYMQWYINHTICYISPFTYSSDNEVSFTSILYIYLSCVLIHGNNPVICVTVDMSQEPPQLASQPYIGHVESSPNFIHPPHQFFG